MSKIIFFYRNRKSFTAKNLYLYEVICKGGNVVGIKYFQQREKPIERIDRDNGVYIRSTPLQMLPGSDTPCLYQVETYIKVSKSALSFAIIDEQLLCDDITGEPISRSTPTVISCLDNFSGAELLDALSFII